MIKLRGIERIFQVGDEKVHALDGIDIDIAQGEYLSIMGPSGSGKSTLLNILGLLDRPTKGIYYFNNINTTELNDTRQAEIRLHKIGFVFQFFHLIPRLTAVENIELPMLLAGTEFKQRKVLSQEILQRVGIADRAKHRPDQLSGGQRQRVAIGRATIMHPDVILADEPTGNLDRASGKDVVDILENLNRSGITLLIVTHDPELGQRARRHIRMVDGRIVKDQQI